MTVNIMLEVVKLIVKLPLLILLLGGLNLLIYIKYLLMAG